MEIRKTETPSRELLLLADEVEASVADYIGRGTCYAACDDGRIVGQYVLIHTRPFTAEVVNIAVVPDRQRQGIATALLAHAADTARRAGFRLLEIGTGNSGFGQIALYERWIRPLRHRRRLFPQAQPYADLRKRRGVPPHGAPEHGVHVTMSVSWNPWHGCRKISEGCRNCYVYRQDSRHDKYSLEVRQTAMFDRPVRRSRDGRFKVPAGEMVYTCFTSDFLLEEADAWRAEAWEMMRIRHDLRFLFFTKRIDLLAAVLPPDWGDGYENVVIGCTVENQAMADYRLLLFLATPVRHRLIVCAPLLGPLDIARYLSPAVEEVSAGGESGNEARPCDYAWVLGLREQCVAADISFCFHQTGARFVKDGRMYRIHRRYQHSQARKAGIDYRLKR